MSKTFFHQGKCLKLKMESATFKVESGVQLLSRLSAKKTKAENFYPMLFESGRKDGDIIEIFSNGSSSFLLIDMVCEALIPIQFGGAETGVLILNTDGHITLQVLTTTLQDKLYSRMKCNSVDTSQMLKEGLNNLYILDIFNATQLYTTLQNLENILLKHSNISLCVIDTFTAFYWSEQSFKITKMDLYLKTLLRIVQKATKGHETTIIYTRPEYFNSNKDLIENLEACCENPTLERINFRIHLLFNDDQTFTATVQNVKHKYKKKFRIDNNKIVWF